MTIQLDMAGFAMMMGIPSAITGFSFWMLQRNLTKRDRKRDKQETARRENELLVIKGVGAALALGEATAKSLQHLDPKCNGEMGKALEYAQTVKHEQKDFLNRQGIENIY